MTVLWLSAALAAIAFALSTTVRGETERASTALDGTRSYYIAAGAVERASMELLWSAQMSGQRPIPGGSTLVHYEFPTGVADVEIIPETARLNVNLAPSTELYRLCLALGIESGRAHEIAAAIDEWRRPVLASDFDAYYLSLTPSFRAPHASFQEIEELLAVKGITPEIYYGTYAPEADEAGQTRLVRRLGLADCLSVFGSRDRVDANTAPAPVLAAIGLNPSTVNALLERRRTAPLSAVQLQEFIESLGASAERLRVGGGSILTLRATARLRLPDGHLSDLKRTVAALVKYMPAGYEPIHVLRWYDTAWSN